MRKALGLFLSLSIAASLLTGCGGGGASSADSSPAKETQEADAGEADVEAADPEADSPEADGRTADGSMDAAGDGLKADTDLVSAGDGGLQPLAGISGTMIGGMRPAEEMEDPDDLTAEDTDRMDRAMRAYTPPADSLLVNRAETFYYYENMSRDEQALYDGMYMCASDPTDTDNIAVANISVDPRSEEFREIQTVAYWGLLYDHPELFWLYNGTEAEMGYGVPYEQTDKGVYTVYYFFDEPFDDFEEMMTEFNDAADDFLEDIDLTASDEVIAEEIHDKLIDTVTYNTPVMEDTSYNGYSNLAHTAYGALVEDSGGNPRYAVCDGYSQAYVYLLQQAGIDAAVIVGVAGNDAADAGGHAWSVVNLDGDWYEVDSTWDDVGSLDEQVEAIRSSDPFSYGYYHEALTDPEYRDKLEHALCYLTTAGIKNYEPDEYYDYVTKDGKYVIRLQTSSIHERADELTSGYEDFGMLMKFAPIAEGVLFGRR